MNPLRFSGVGDSSVHNVFTLCVSLKRNNLNHQQYGSELVFDGSMNYRCRSDFGEIYQNDTSNRN